MEAEFLDALDPPRRDELRSVIGLGAVGWALTSGAFYRRFVLDDRPVGPLDRAPMRGRQYARRRLEAVVAQRDQIPDLALLAQRLCDEIVRRWPDAAGLPTYPAFGWKALREILKKAGRCSVERIMTAKEFEMKLDDRIAVDEHPVDRSRSLRHTWRKAAAIVGAAAAAAATLVIAAAPSRDGGSTVLEQRAEPSAPPSSDSPAPAPEGLSDSSRLRLDGIGPIIVGMTLEEASAAAGMPVRIIPNSDLVGIGSCAYARAEGGPAGLSFMVLAGRIARIDVVGNSTIRTMSGVGIGSMDVEVQATYPGRISVQPNPYSGHRGGRHLVYQADEASRHLGLLFQTDAGRVSSFRSGSHGAVMAPEGCA